jgi:DNA-binding beta-propeller fold protein YncE
MGTSRLCFLRRRISLNSLVLTLLGIFIFLLLFFDYFYFADRPLPRVELPFFDKVLSKGPQFITSIDEFKGEKLKGPVGIAVSQDGKVYVTDSGNSRIIVFSNEGKPLLQFGKFGTLEGELNYPYAIAVDKNNNVYVGQFKTPRIQVFDSKGKFIRKIDKSVTGQTVAPLAMTIDKQGLLYVANQDGKILVLDSLGKLIKVFGGAGSGDGFFSYPKGIFVDEQNIYVSDTNNLRLQIFSKDGTLKKVVTKITLSAGMPTGITVSQGGVIYIVDTFSNRINIYNQEFKITQTIGRKGIGDGEFYFPVGIVTDQYGKLYVTDTANNRISVFQR